MHGDRSASETEELCYKDLKECIRRRNATNVSSLVVEKRERASQPRSSPEQATPTKGFFFRLASIPEAINKEDIKNNPGLDRCLPTQHDTTRHEQDDDLRFSADKKQIFP
jgi:hypothetical protein